VSAISDYFISSRAWTTETPTIDGTPVNVTAPANGLYLWHSTASLSLLDRFVSAMTTAGVAAPDAYITELGYIRLVSSGVFSVTWNLATLTRDLLGFTGDLAGASSYTAPNRSTLLWRAGKRVTSANAPRGAHGQKVADLSVHQGPVGVQTVRQEGAPTVINRYSVRHVPKDRFFATPPTEAAGDFLHFWEAELLTNQRIILALDAREGQDAGVEADLSSVAIVGPYRANLVDPTMRRGQFSRDSGFERVEAYYPVSVPVIQTAEFT
jgi:hypothetical protein